MKVRLTCWFFLLVLILGGCKSQDNQIADLLKEVKSLGERLTTLEKLVLPQAPAEQESAYELPVGDSPVLGKKDAKVSITVFSNFQCPYCARADKLLRAVVEDQELKDKVNLVFKHFPFERHPQARKAAKASLASKEQGKFWPMAEKIFLNQGELSDEKYVVWAKELELDVDKFNQDLKDNDSNYSELIDNDIKLGTEEARLEGTPWILVGGWLLDGEISADNIKSLIKEKNL